MGTLSFDAWKTNVEEESTLLSTDAFVRDGTSLDKFNGRDSVVDLNSVRTEKTRYRGFRRDASGAFLCIACFGFLGMGLLLVFVARPQLLLGRPVNQVASTTLFGQAAAFGGHPSPPPRPPPSPHPPPTPRPPPTPA